MDCPSGNAAGFMKDGMTCTELTDARNYECYNSVIETQCCESCNNISGTNSGGKIVSFRSFFCRYILALKSKYENAQTSFILLITQNEPAHEIMVLIT